MKMEYDIAKIAQLIGEPSRAAILVALMQAKALTAGELSRLTNTSAQTTSNHLKKLVHANLITCQQAGRHRYYRLMSHQVATALESLSIVSSHQSITPPAHKHLDKQICFARTCYDHMAGKLGISLTAAMLEKHYLEHDDKTYRVTAKGSEFFATLGINCDALKTKRRAFARPCLDWTQRDYHLAGSLGKAVLDYFYHERLVIVHQQKARVLVLTTKGRLWLNSHLDITL